MYSYLFPLVNYLCAVFLSNILSFKKRLNFFCSLTDLSGNLTHVRLLCLCVCSEWFLVFDSTMNYDYKPSYWLFYFCLVYKDEKELKNIIMNGFFNELCSFRLYQNSRT